VLAGAGAHPTESREEVERRLAALAGAPHGPLRSPLADGELLLQILERDGAVAAWLRERGVDQAAVRRMLGEA
jgi:hypothetical protein